MGHSDLGFFFVLLFVPLFTSCVDRYRPYEEDWPYWEVALQLQKCMLTGAMCAIEPGSPLQLVIALLCCLAYMLLVLFAGPCKFFFAGLFLIFLARFLSDLFAGLILIVINVLPFLYFFCVLCSVLFVGVF